MMPAADTVISITIEVTIEEEAAVHIEKIHSADFNRPLETLGEHETR
jgi:hypothetical protein